MSANGQTPRRAAYAYRKARLSVIPIQPGGRKNPYGQYLPGGKWAQLVGRLPSKAEMGSMFPANVEMGVAILG